MNEQQTTPMADYVAALDRTADAARALADTLRGATTEDTLLKHDVLTRWKELSAEMSSDAQLIHEAGERYQKWATARFKERIERASYRLPSYQR
jgi:hypothetical protein